MARYSLFLLLWSMFAGVSVVAQSRYIVHFKDKNGSPFSIDAPEQFLSQRAIDRRARQGISITIADLPVNSSYIEQVRSTGAKVFFTSRWMNCALVQADDAQLLAISGLPGVMASELVAPGAHAAGGRIKQYKNRNGSGIAAPTMGQLSMVGIDTMHMDGLRGQGILVAMFDSGYPGVNTSVPFQHLYDENRIHYTYDFVGAGTNVYRYDDHGTQVFSVIAGHSDLYTGGAYKATFQLYVTEESDSEYRIEEYNWLFAAERADSSGVDLISASLGYNTFDDASMDYSKSQLDGVTAVVSRAAAAAIDRGIVVVCSAGNEGTNSWGLVTPPADVEGILSVGSVTAGGTKSAFSSIGPTADNRIKPEVVSMGSSTAVVRPSGSVGTISGTSVAAPIISSLAAGIMQRFPTLSAQDVQSAIVTSGSQATSPDNLLGYGIPFYPRIVRSLAPYQGDEPIEIYPNPTENGKFRVMVEQVNQDVEVQIFDLRGTSLAKHVVAVTWENNPFELDLSGLAAGSYLVKVKTRDNFKTTTLIRQ